MNHIRRLLKDDPRMAVRARVVPGNCGSLLQPLQTTSKLFCAYFWTSCLLFSRENRNTRTGPTAFVQQAFKQTSGSNFAPSLPRNFPCWSKKTGENDIFGIWACAGLIFACFFCWADRQVFAWVLTYAYFHHITYAWKFANVCERIRHIQKLEVHVHDMYADCCQGSQDLNTEYGQCHAGTIGACQDPLPGFHSLHFRVISSQIFLVSLKSTEEKCRPILNSTAARGKSVLMSWCVSSTTSTFSRFMVHDPVCVSYPCIWLLCMLFSLPKDSMRRISMHGMKVMPQKSGYWPTQDQTRLAPIQSEISFVCVYIHAYVCIDVPTLCMLRSVFHERSLVCVCVYACACVSAYAGMNVCSFVLFFSHLCRE